MPHQHMHTKSMPGKRQMGGRNWPFGHGGHEGHGNQNPRLNQRSEGSNGGSEGDTGTTAKPAPTAKPTANPTANSPGTTQRQTIVHTSILDLSPSVTVVLGETTFATHYTDFDTLAIDTQAITFSSGPQPTSGAGGSNNLNSGSINMNQNGGANGTANKQGSDGGLGGGAIAGIIGTLMFSLPFSSTIPS